MEKEWSASFEFVKMNEYQQQRADLVRKKISALANELQSLLPADGEAGRYRSMAKTKLEEMNWAATKCVSRSTHARCSFLQASYDDVKE